MKKTIPKTPKKIGRPATGRDPLASARLPKEMIVAVKSWAVKHETSLSDAIRQLIERGLNAPARWR